MWDMKSIMLFICSLLVVILLTVKANANPVLNWFEAGNWLTGEVEKTKAYQTKVWSEAKNKWPWTMFKSKNNASQN